MTVRIFLLGALVAFLVGAGAWGLVVTQLDPTAGGPLGLALFFLSFFVAAAGVTSLVGYGVRRIVLPHLFATYAVRTSLRQGVMISVFLSVLLFLQLWRLYQWWVAVILVVLLVLFELVFLSYDRSHHRHTRNTAG